MKTIDTGNIIDTNKDVWMNADSGDTFTDKKEAFKHFEYNGIHIADLRKYPMNEDLAKGMAEWHSKFIKHYDKFNTAIINKLPEIKNVAPSSLGYGTLGQFSYYTNGKVVGIKLYSGLHSSFDYAR